MIQRPLIILTALIALAPHTFAQEQSAKNSKPLRTAIRAARLLDVKTGALI